MRKLKSVLSILLLLLASCKSVDTSDTLSIPEDAVARVAYFSAEDCSLCQDIFDDVLEPLVQRCGNSLELKKVQVDEDEGYDLFIETESYLIGDSGRWDIPTIVVGETYFIGEDAIRSGLLPELQCVLGEGGNAWPNISNLIEMENQNSNISEENAFLDTEPGAETCIDEEEAAVCASPNPLYVLYLYSEACESECDRTVYDLRYLKGLYPHLFYEEMSIEENQPLAQAIVKEFGLTLADDLLAPAIVIGSEYLIGNDLILENLKTVLAKYADAGALPVWYTLEVD